VAGPIKRLKGFGCAAILGSVNYLSLSIQCFLCRQVSHTLGRETSPDNIARQILKPLVVIGPDGGPAIDIKAAVALAEHIFNDRIVYFALGFEHLEHLILKQILQIFGIRLTAFGECAAG